MSYSQEALVSVIIPCYNSENFIARTIKSLVTQSYTNLQIVCINDGSTDDTQKLLERLSKEDNRIEVLQKENGGVEAALKQGATLLRGEYVFPIGHDDTITSDAIAEAVQAFQTNTELDAVRMDLKFVFDDPSKNYVMDDRRVLSGTEALLETLDNWRIHTFCLWRSSIFQKIAEVDAKGAFNFDELATRYFYIHCRNVGYCNGVYNYFQHEQSVTKVKSVRRLQALLVDTLLRQMLVSSGLYTIAAATFEKYALQHLVNMGTMFFSMKHLHEQDRQLGRNHLKTAFNLLNKKRAIASASGIKQMAWSVLFSSPAMFLAFLKAKSLYQEVRS